MANSVTINILQRLPRYTLVELMNKWPKIINTQPHLTKDLHQRQWNKLVLLEVSKFRDNKANKRKIIEKVFEFWSNGLNLLQLSQIDCQLIVDKPNSYSWILSIVKDSKGKEIPLLLDPKKFLDMLSRDLNFIFMTHIYVCKHPKLPLILIRIQVFDLQTVSSSKNSNRPHISSNRPYFLAIPIGSPYIIHSPGKDLVSEIVMQVVERNLPQVPNNLITIDTDYKQHPVKSLEAMNVLYGNSRFSNSLGAWTSYADSTIDISPLNDIDNHKLLNEDKENQHDIKSIANLRFKGNYEGKITSDFLFNESPRRKKRKTTQFEDKEEEEIIKDEFSSLAPVQNAEFLIQQNHGDEYSNITLKLSGADVFGGLHELSVQAEEKELMILDPSEMPSWLTGEEGRSHGTVRDGLYYKN